MVAMVRTAALVDPSYSLYVVPLVHAPHRHLDRFVRFYTAHGRDQHADRQTNHRTSYTLYVGIRHGTGSLGHRVNGSFGSSFTSGSPGHRIIILTLCETRVFPVFEKNAQTAKRTFEMLKWRKSLSGVWLLDWNHWISVRAINFYFYLWSLKTYWPEDTS